MRVVRKCRRSSPCRAVGVDDDARARRRSVSLLVALVSFFFSFVSQRRFSKIRRLRFAVRRTFGGARHLKVGDRFSPARTRVRDSEIRHYRRSRNTNENRAPDRSFVFPARVDDSKTVRDASLVFHTEDWRELGAGRLCVWERKRPARLLERRQRRARKHTFDRRSHVSRAASSSRASVRSSAFKRNLPRRGVRRCAAAHAKPHARRPAGVA